LSGPQDRGLPFSAWSLTRLAYFLVAEGVVDDVSHEGLRVLLREESVSFQRLKTWKTSRDRAYEAKKIRILHLYGLMDGTADVLDGDPEVVICMGEFGPLNLQPHPGRQWAVAGVTKRPFQLGDPIYEFVLLGRFAVSSRSAINLPALPYSSFLIPHSSRER
jgi:hypothetical protein